MKKLIVFALFTAALFATACDKEESLPLDQIAGVWCKQEPAGLQTEGFVTWSFDEYGVLEVRVYDVFSGDHVNPYEYRLFEDHRSLAVLGDIRNADGVVVRDTLVLYEVVKLTKNRMRLRRTWVNTAYDGLAPEEKNTFLLDGYTDVSFKRSKE